MKTLLLIVCFLFLAKSSFAQTGIRSLPKGAVIVEQRTLPVPNRALVLWMLHPKKNPSDYGSDEVIPCPSQTRGSYYSGPTRVSLVNSTTKAIINTVKIEGDSIAGEGAEGALDVPYAIRKGYYYHVAARVRRTVEAKPTIMWLRDYNGDGKALEFALFDAPACMGLQTILVGYSNKRDRVIQYPIVVDVFEGSKQSRRSLFWIDYLFIRKPIRPAYWKYEVDYTGRGGTLDKWEVRYNQAQERFEGKLIVKPGE